MSRPAVRGNGHGDWLLSHASINGVKITLEHKIEEDSTGAWLYRSKSMRKLTYNKMCPCTINLVRKEKEALAAEQNSAKEAGWSNRASGTQTGTLTNEH